MRQRSTPNFTHRPPGHPDHGLSMRNRFDPSRKTRPQDGRCTLTALLVMSLPGMTLADNYPPPPGPYRSTTQTYVAAPNRPPAPTQFRDPVANPIEPPAHATTPPETPWPQPARAGGSHAAPVPTPAAGPQVAYPGRPLAQTGAAPWSSPYPANSFTFRPGSATSSPPPTATLPPVNATPPASPGAPSWSASNWSTQAPQWQDAERFASPAPGIGRPAYPSVYPGAPNRAQFRPPELKGTP